MKRPAVGISWGTLWCDVEKRHASPSSQVQKRRGAPNRSPTKSSLWDLCGWKDTEAGNLIQAWQSHRSGWSCLGSREITVSEESLHYDKSWKHAIPDSSRKGGVVLKGHCAPNFLHGARRPEQKPVEGKLSGAQLRGRGQLVQDRYYSDKGFHCGESRALTYRTPRQPMRDVPARVSRLSGTTVRSDLSALLQDPGGAKGNLVMGAEVIERTCKGEAASKVAMDFWTLWTRESFSRTR